MKEHITSRAFYETLTDRIVAMLSTERIQTNRVTRPEVLDYLENNAAFKAVIWPRLRTEFPWINERAATDEDFHAFCDREGVEVVFAPEILKGIYVRTSWGSHHIFLNSEMEEATRHYVMFHEVAHYLFHEPGYCITTRSKTCSEREIARKHLEAEIVTALCNSRGTAELVLTV